MLESEKPDINDDKSDPTSSSGEKSSTTKQSDIKLPDDENERTSASNKHTDVIMQDQELS